MIRVHWYANASLSALSNVVFFIENTTNNETIDP